VSIVLWTRLEALEKRVAALEDAAKAAEKNSLAEPVSLGLARSNAMRKAEGERLREEIRRIIGAHAGPKSLSAAAVVHELSSRAGGRTVALRTVQWHLHAIRNARSVALNPSSTIGGDLSGKTPGVQTSQLSRPL
jgi:hypothetical protein